MKSVVFSALAIFMLAGCASKAKEFDQRSYDRQNKAAEKSLNTL